MKKMNSLLVKGFQASKCKTQLRLGTSRIKLLRNKKLAQIASDRREVAELLRNKQDNNARLLVEHVIIEQDLIEAYDLLSLYAERIAAQLPVIDSQKTCPPDLKENISTLLYASSRCAELPDFAQIRPMFVAKYGKEFVSGATELRPGCGVNVKVVEKLSSNGATGETKLRILKEIAAEHNVDWDPAAFEREGRVGRDDVLPGPTLISGADTSSSLVDDFPSVPNQRPTLGTNVSQPANITNPTSGKFDDVDSTNSPRPRDDRMDSLGAFPRAGPPSRSPPGRDQSRAEDPKFDVHPDIDSGSREAQSQRNQRRESDSFVAPSPQTRHEAQDTRRNSIGVPREKSSRFHTDSGRGDVDESLLRDYKKHNQREAGSEGIDEASDMKGSHGTDGRQSQKFTGKEVFGKGRSELEDQYADEDKFRRTSNRDGSGKGRPQHETQYSEDKLGRVSKRNGSVEGRLQHEDPYPEEDKLARVSNRDGSRKGMSQNETQYAEGDELRRDFSREGSGDKMPYLETAVEEGSRGRISARVKGDKLYAGRKPKHDYSDEDADHVPHRNEEPRRRESTSKTSKHEDSEWDDEHFRNSVTTRGPRNSEDEYRVSGEGRNSSNRRTSGEDMSRKSSKPSVPKEVTKYPKERDPSDVPQFDSSGDEYESSGNEYDSRRSGAKKPESRFKTADIRNLDRSSEPGEEDSRKDARRTSRLSIVDEQRRDPRDDQGSSRGRRPGREDPVNDHFSPSSRTSRLSIVDEQRRDPRDDQGSSRGRRPGREDPVNDHFSPSSRTSKDSEKRMSLPGGSGHDKSNYQGNRAHDYHDDSVRRRATLGPEEIRHARTRETTDAPKSRFGEREKQVESRRQSAPLSKEDGMEGRQSQRDKTDRHAKVDVPAHYDDDRLPRFNPNVSLRDDDEYTPSPRTSRDRSDRQRTAEIPARFDDGRPPPRFIKVGSQPNVDDEDSRGSPASKGDKPQRFVTRNEPRSRTNLQTVKTDPELSGTPKSSSQPDHRKSRSALAESSSPASKPVFKKPPDLDSLIQMFAPKK